MNDTFQSLGLTGPWLERLASRGIERPAPIQAVAVPALLAGGDAVIRAQTGSGKTLAYLLPVLEKLDAASNRLQAIVLTPTAELAMQIVKEATELTEGTTIRALALIGGASLQRQLDKLKTHPQLVVGTPGRIREILQIKKMKVSDVRTIVVDEADQTFALGEGGEAERILAALPSSRQTVFCSATMGDAARAIVMKWTKAASWIEAESADEEEANRKLPSTVEHVFVVAEERDRIDTVRRLLRALQPRAAILFVNKTESIAEVEAKLQYHGLAVEAIYGDQPKQERTAVMRKFRSGKLKLLLATDVAARGIDAADVTHVIHVDPPLDEERYLHRAGRTGRMGRYGMSVLVLTPNRKFIAEKFAEALDIAIEERKLDRGELRGPRTRPGAGKPASASERPAGASASAAPAAPGASAPASAAANREGARPRPASGGRREDAAGKARGTAPTLGAKAPRSAAGTGAPNPRAGGPDRRDSRGAGASDRRDSRGVGSRADAAVSTVRPASPGGNARVETNGAPRPTGIRLGGAGGAAKAGNGAGRVDANARDAGGKAGGAPGRGVRTAAAASNPAAAAKKPASDRKRNAKEKGAPRWLKEKRRSNGGETNGDAPNR